MTGNQVRRRRARTGRRAFYAQGNELAQKAIADIAVTLGTRIAANYLCTRPDPDYFLCRATNDLANQQAEDLRKSVLQLGIWFGAAMLADIFERM